MTCVSCPPPAIKYEMIAYPLRAEILPITTLLVVVPRPWWRYRIDVRILHDNYGTVRRPVTVPVTLCGLNFLEFEKKNAVQLHPAARLPFRVDDRPLPTASAPTARWAAAQPGMRPWHGQPAPQPKRRRHV